MALRIIIASFLILVSLAGIYFAGSLLLDYMDVIFDSEGMNVNNEDTN